jgi:hypothetical protein
MIPATQPEREPSSFRDPDGFVFVSEGRFLRWVGPRYKDVYNKLVEGGLRESLVKKGLFLPFEEATREPLLGAYKILLPRQIPFVSYPYEWCFSQLKDSALATLEIQRIALKHGMSLKDASAYNIQFIDGKPSLADTLSFEIYREGQPWVAFRQFCEHFLAPLALMSYRDVRLSQLLRSYLDGVPLNLARRLMPLRTWLRPGLLAHLHLHSLAKHANTDLTRRVTASRSFSTRSFYGLVDHLQSTIESLRWRPPPVVWSTYDSPDLIGSPYFVSKQRVVETYLEQLDVRTAWDFGANNGYFSRILASRGTFTVALDSDHACIETSYLKSKEEGSRLLLPLVMDLTNPSSSAGWANQERRSVFQRGRPDLILSLALVHHLVIGNNLSFKMVAELFSKQAEYLIVEFVPKDDSRVQSMLQGREDIFPCYDQTEFESQFQNYFVVERRDRLESSSRVIYLMRRREPKC